MADEKQFTVTLKFKKTTEYKVVFGDADPGSPISALYIHKNTVKAKLGEDTKEIEVVVTRKG